MIEYDEVVAKVLNLRWVSTMGWMLPNKGGSSGFRLEIHLDWNALMAVVKKLEPEHEFRRTRDCWWEVWRSGHRLMCASYSDQPEAVALCKCIERVAS